MDALPALVWHEVLSFLDIVDVAQARLAHSLFREASRGYHTASASLVSGVRAQLDLLAGMHELRTLRLRVDGLDGELMGEALRALTARPRLLELRVGHCWMGVADVVHGWHVEGHTDVVADGWVQLCGPNNARRCARTLSLTAHTVVLTGVLPGLRRLVERGHLAYQAKHAPLLPNLEEAVAAGALAGGTGPPALRDWDRAPSLTPSCLEALIAAAPNLRTLVWGRVEGPFLLMTCLAMRGFPHLRELRLFFSHVAEGSAPVTLPVPAGLEVLHLAAEHPCNLHRVELGPAPRLVRLAAWWVSLVLAPSLPALRELDLLDALHGPVQGVWPCLARVRFGGPLPSVMGRYAVDLAAGRARLSGFRSVSTYKLPGCGPCVELRREPSG